mmetsp:Transcript_43398/g.105185  ORF Transcript_43398/g.105185 Transcript_43398/m.105185 type:complete len:90 (+) Transcript_43398:626-895(+)
MIMIHAHSVSLFWGSDETFVIFYILFLNIVFLVTVGKYNKKFPAAFLFLLVPAAAAVRTISIYHHFKDTFHKIKESILNVYGTYYTTDK